MSKWLRIDVNFRRHPRVRRAGFWGTLASQLAWEISKEFDLGGVVHRAYWDAEYLQHHASIPDECLDALKIGMKAAEAARLIIDAGEFVEIHDWDEYQRDISTDRVKRHRVSKRSSETGVNGDGTIERSDRTEQNRTEHNRTEKDVPTLPSEASRLSAVLRLAVLQYKADHSVRRDSVYAAKQPKWSADIDKLQRLDGVSWHRIGTVLAWLPQDDFWPANIQSGAKLRKHFDALEARMREAGRCKRKPNEAAPRQDADF